MAVAYRSLLIESKSAAGREVESRVVAVFGDSSMGERWHRAVEMQLGPGEVR